MNTLPGPLDSVGSLSEIQLAIAKKLIIIDPRLFSFIVLYRLARENERGQNATEAFLLKMGVSHQEIYDWTMLSAAFGPQFKFTNQLVMKTLRLGT